MNFCRTELPAPDVTRRFLIARWVNLGSTVSIYGVDILDAEQRSTGFRRKRLRVDRVTQYVVVADRDGEIA